MCSWYTRLWVLVSQPCCVCLRLIYDVSAFVCQGCSRRQRCVRMMMTLLCGGVFYSRPNRDPSSEGSPDVTTAASLWCCALLTLEQGVQCEHVQIPPPAGWCLHRQPPRRCDADGDGLRYCDKGCVPRSGVTGVPGHPYTLQGCRPQGRSHRRTPCLPGFPIHYLNRSLPRHHGRCRHYDRFPQQHQHRHQHLLW